ncbi:hypothetical protein F5Y10DRAFT_289494 [Nemania abortiva]|nr:hypothetical protein F5Y10DRAFT_289494 [Nemania abortiva]
MDKANVYLGVWTNHSNGTILGATLTTTQRQGAILIAFTGFLIPVVASSFWKLACLILHRIHSTSEPRDAIHHQRQVILRNSPSPDTGLVSSIQAIWAWRTKRRESLPRILPLVGYATTCISIFTVAGGLSSQIYTAGSTQVLLKGEKCGIPYVKSSNDSAAMSYFSERTANAANYAQQCYGENYAGIGCDMFVTKSLPTVLTDYDADCPFQGHMCRGNGTSLRLDTGYIDSNHHLGLNLPKGRGFAYRTVLSCSPIITEGYTTSSIVGNRTSVNYHYGILRAPDGTVINHTFQSEDLDIQYYRNHIRGVISSQNYKLTVLESETINGKNNLTPGFIPNPEISRADGDVSIVFLAGNGVIFSQPMDDQWYRATVPARNVTISYMSNSSKSPTYMPKEAASPLGCVEQHQWCNTAYSGESGCGPLASIYDSYRVAAVFFNLTKEELSTPQDSVDGGIGTRLIWPGLIRRYWNTGAITTVAALGETSLLSQRLLTRGVQSALPQNQWQLDVTNWWNASLASLQSSFVYTAMGPTIQSFPPLNNEERSLCNSQKILSNAYSSFNLLALLLIYITSSLIIIFSYVAEPLLACLSRRYKYKQYELLEWTTNTSLQLHRLAHESTSPGSWSGGADKVPTTTQNEMLAHLDISNPVHPVLAQLESSGSDTTPK